MSATPFASAFAAQSPDEIRSGLSSHDRALHIKDGWIRDPYIYLAPDGLYYLTGTTPEPGDPREFGDPYNSGLDNPGITGSLKPAVVGTKIRVWRSADLITWESVGPVFDLRDGYWAGAAPEAFATVPEADWRLWAPELIQLDGKWILVHTSPSPVKQGANLIVSSGGDLAGPWTFPMGAEMLGKHDPSLFRDVDGIVYLLWGNTSIAPLKQGYNGFAAEPVRIDPSDRRIGHEGATLRKIGRKYVHFGTAWSTDQMRKGTYNLYYCTADTITGPYGPRRFAGRFLGHGTPFQDKDGQWWCTAFFNANVPPISPEDALKPWVGDNAHTINLQGVTLVPLDVRILEDGDVSIRAIDPAYANPGPEEADPE
ncbi:MAG: family 43 glycosylhydrolase [Opitutaceae bacterium]